MIKLITNSFDFKAPTISKIGRSGFEKKAGVCAEVDKYLKSKLKQEEGKTKFHILFLGAGEYYSSNRNGDWFGKQDLINKHKTFEQFGHVFRHHVNKDPSKKYGDIEYTIYSPVMNRVEGIISLDNSQNQDILEKYDNGEDIPVSMAAKLNYDVCSICGHRSKKLDEYCDHLKFEMNNILEDGRKVYAINPNPIFFDLSLVWRPADPTAYFFSKVAETKDVRSLSLYWGEYLFKNSSAVPSETSIEKRAIVKKLADLEKHIEGALTGKATNNQYIPLLNAVHEVKDFPHSVLSDFKKLPLHSVLSSLSDYKIQLTLPEFLSLLGKGDLISEVKSLLPGSFSKLMQEPDEDMFDLDFGLSSDPLPIFSKIKNLLSSRSLDDNFFDGKTMVFNLKRPDKTSISLSPGGFGFSRSSGSGKIILKTANNAVADKLAKIYNLYKLSFCKKNPNRISMLYSILSNYSLEDDK